MFPLPKGGGSIEATVTRFSGCASRHHCRKAVAPLKLVGEGDERPVGVCQFPLPKGGGSIEAERRGHNAMSSFPLPKGGGSIEARIDLGQAFKRYRQQFPLPKGGGSIEAGSQGCYRRQIRSFHCRKAVAPVEASIDLRSDSSNVSTAERRWLH